MRFDATTATSCLQCLSSIPVFLTLSNLQPTPLLCELLTSQRHFVALLPSTLTLISNPTYCSNRTPTPHSFPLAVSIVLSPACKEREREGNGVPSNAHPDCSHSSSCRCDSSRHFFPTSRSRRPLRMPRLFRLCPTTHLPVRKRSPDLQHLQRACPVLP